MRHYTFPFSTPVYVMRRQWLDLDDDCGDGDDGKFLNCKLLLDLVSADSEDEASNCLANLVRRSFRYFWSFACHNGADRFIMHCLTTLGILTDAPGLDPRAMDAAFKNARDYSP